MTSDARTRRQNYRIADRLITLLSNAAPVCAADENGLPVSATDPSAVYFDPISAIVRIGHESPNLRVACFTFSLNKFGNSILRQTRNLTPWYNLFSSSYSNDFTPSVEAHIAEISNIIAPLVPSFTFRERLKTLRPSVLPRHLAGASLQYDAAVSIRA